MTEITDRNFVEQIRKFLDTSKCIRIDYLAPYERTGFLRCKNCGMWLEFFPIDELRCPSCASVEVYKWQGGIEPSFDFELASPIREGTVFKYARLTKKA